MITKAVSDVDDCIEGMRKFTTEIFDTGVALLGYAVMLFIYDWHCSVCFLHRFRTFAGRDHSKP